VDEQNLRYRLERGATEVMLILYSPGRRKRRREGYGQLERERKGWRGGKRCRRTNSGDTDDGSKLSGLSVNLDGVVEVLEWKREQIIVK